MQFFATENVVNSQYPDFASVVVPVIPFSHPEIKVVISFGRYRVFG